MEMYFYLKSPKFSTSVAGAGLAWWHRGKAFGVMAGPEDS